MALPCPSHQQFVSTAGPVGPRSAYLTQRVIGMCSYYTSTLSLTFPVLNVLNNAAIDKLSLIQNELLHVCLVSVFPLNSSKIIWEARELSFESFFWNSITISVNVIFSVIPKDVNIILSCQRNKVDELGQFCGCRCDNTQ